MPISEGELQSGVEASLTISIAGHPYTLTGIVGTQIVVYYHASPDTGIVLGNIVEMAEHVGEALGLSSIGKAALDLANAVNNSTIPVFSQIATVVLTAPIVITDLVINTETKIYQFGFALDFTGLSIGINHPVQLSLLYFSLKVTQSSSS